MQDLINDLECLGTHSTQEWIDNVKGRAVFALNETMRIHPEREDLIARIADWLCKGGLWNPDLMEKQKTTDLMLDIRAALSELTKQSDGTSPSSTRSAEE